MTLRYGLEIRAAAAGDAAGLASLLGEAGHAVRPRALAERLAALRQGPGTALIAAQWGPPAGLLVLHWYPTLEAAGLVAQVTTLLVGEEHRRSGIGRLLLKAAAQAARQAGCDRMEIPATTEAVSLYEFCRATGFVEAGPRFLRSLRRQETGRGG